MVILTQIIALLVIILDIILIKENYDKEKLLNEIIKKNNTRNYDV